MITEHSIKEHPVHGKCLYCGNGVVEIAVPLEFGLRVAHFSFAGEENVFFVQPREMKEFNTADGWKLRGGHRLWIAPERAEDYCPDNDPIAYTLDGGVLKLVQNEDPKLHIVKEWDIEIEENRVALLHRVRNVGSEPLRCALWALSLMAPGGVETIPLPKRSGGFDPLYTVSAWDFTDLGDKRLQFAADEIRITQLPVKAKFKIGVGHPAGPVKYENNGTVFVQHYEIEPDGEYTDGGVSFETFFFENMAEIESLSAVSEVAPGGVKEFREVWELRRA